MVELLFVGVVALGGFTQNNVFLSLHAGDGMVEYWYWGEFGPTGKD